MQQPHSMEKYVLYVIILLQVFTYCPLFDKYILYLLCIALPILYYKYDPNIRLTFQKATEPLQSPRRCKPEEIIECCEPLSKYESVITSELLLVRK